MIKKLSAISLALFSLIAAAEELIYCPEKIECNIYDDFNSCAINDNKFKYWDNIFYYKTEHPRIEKREYLFEHATKYSHNSFMTCFYGDPGLNPIFSINSNRLVYLQVYSVKGALWHHHGSDQICDKQKKYLSPLECPFKLRPDIVIYPKEVGIRLFLNNHEVKPDKNNFPLAIFVNSFDCPIRDHCRLDVDGSVDRKNFFKIGYILINPDNSKIIDIFSYQESSFKIKKHENFNSVTIDKNSLI